MNDTSTNCTTTEAPGTIPVLQPVTSRCASLAGIPEFAERLGSELAVLERLNEDIDQLASEARDCDGIAPEVKRALDLAWWFAEDAIREERGAGSCGHVDATPRKSAGGWCACCQHFSELSNRARSLRGRF